MDFDVKLSIDPEKIDNLVMDEVSFIKIDTQRGELDILMGADRTLDHVLGMDLEIGFLEIY